ncbi:sulfurtransferase [Nocardiopsis sp. CT-R113]|uniref:Sulfurtransferase n=1 Tax=Nocardiopsis codii TaxID=3065942 RepID=A0ABU7K2C5_9ACTN|nr:sulfurtransferase [Nocardiopsis sp. CT-R113]MEE2036014.1 sulfurtransferase [Nocardiopsis sp. CT-R113]
MSEPLTLPVAVSADWLREHRDQVVVVDSRWYLDGRSGRDAYRAGHLPGAVFADVDTDLAAPAGPGAGRHPLPSPADFADALGRLGVGDAASVVVYDDAGGSVAARLVWMLRALGTPAAFLDGGLRSWTGELEEGEAVPPPAHRTARPWPSDLVVDTDTVRAESGDPGSLLVDARAYGRFTGEQPAPVDARPGHVPGARSAEWTGNLDGDGFLAAPEVLRERFAALGADSARTVTAYCGSGVTACHDLLALEHAGYAGARLYPGSWSLWGADDSLPAETGDPGA